MDESNLPQEDANHILQKEEKEDTRINLINAVQTPLGFFVLVVLVVEAIFGITASFSDGVNQTYLIVGMLVLIFSLVLIVAGMAIFRPISLYGKSTKDSGQEKPLFAQEAVVEGSVDFVEKPKIFLAGPSEGGFLDTDSEIIRNAFPAATLMTEPNVTTRRFQELFTKNVFDIVQLTANVSSDGSITFWTHAQNETRSIPGEGIVRLLEVAETKLLVLACCRSVPLAARLAATGVNMIAATENLQVEPFFQWEDVFYRLLSKGYPLSRAYTVAEASVDLPLVILMKRDVVFAKPK